MSVAFGVHLRPIDSFPGQPCNAPGVSQRQIAHWIEDYGEDSDFVRTRVKGEFPADTPTR